jgi:hypothetical protein
MIPTMVRHSVVGIVIAALGVGCHWIAPLSGGAPDAGPRELGGPDTPATADGDRKDRGPADAPGPYRDARLPDAHVFDAKHVPDAKPLFDSGSSPDIKPSPDAAPTTCASFMSWTQLGPCSMTDGCSYTCSTLSSTYVVTCDPYDPLAIGLCRCATNGGPPVPCGPRVEKNNICYYPCNYWATLKPCCLP